MAAEARLSVEVVYATPEEQVVVVLEVPRGTTAAEAVERSGLATRFPEIEKTAHLGVYGRLVPAATQLRAGDRVEVYRPLVADPKQARRRRAAAAKP
jgi:putative ubiquitin-RnfH superfamily antitoxin RatB of RatAB toxin-antitoxin module